MAEIVLDQSASNSPIGACRTLCRFSANVPALRRAVPTTPLRVGEAPAEHRVRLVDENIQPLEFEDLARADIVRVTGINV